MNNPHANHTASTRIALVLDRSGSMASIREAARDAFNEAISRVQIDAAQNASSGMETTLSVVTFNHEVDDKLVNAPVRKARMLGHDDYRPGGSTALLDATAHAIDLIERAGPLGARDGALVIVISDGHENASTQVSQSDLVERMQKLEGTEQWTFSFLMANVDITDLSRQLRTEASNYAAWNASAAGAHAMKEDLAVGMSDYMVDRRAGMRSKKEFFEKKQRTEVRRVSRRNRTSS